MSNGTANRRTARRLTLSVFAIVLACLGFQTQAAADQLLRKGNGPEVESLDPHKAEGVSAADILRDLYEGLVGEAPDSSLIAGAAESWTVSEDLKTYTFTMRENGRWSNGDPVTAMDFVVGLRRSVDPATGSAYSAILAPIENAEAVIEGKLPPERLGVEAVDDRTLIIRLKGPTPYFLGMLIHSSAYAVHRPSLEKYGAQFAQPGKLVGNGAYRLVDRVIQSHITLERNEHYWDNDNTTIERVQYLNTEDVNSEFKRFRANEIDWTSTVPTNQRDWVRKNLPDSYHSNTYLGVYYYGLNLARPPFKDDPKLRMALSMAIDRKIITEKLLGWGEQPADSWVPPGVIGHENAKAAWSGLTREERLERARQLYAEAGYSRENPAEVEIRYNTSEDHKKIATVLSGMWNQWLGVKTTLINEEWKVYLQNRRLGVKTQVFRAGWIGDYNDANTFLEILQSQHGLNDTGYKSTEYDELLALASVEPDPVQRGAYQKQAEAVLLRDLPVIPIYFYVSKRLVKPKVKGWIGNIMNHHPTRFLRIED